VGLDKFDFAARPGGLLYIGVYVLAAMGVSIILLQARTLRAAKQAA